MRLIPFRTNSNSAGQLTLDPPEATTGKGRDQLADEDYLTLSTIHSAKGREWKCVHILNVVDGCIPSDMADDVEKERRLLHVAMTRAKDFLDLLIPLRFYKYRHSNVSDRHMYASVSQFIPEHIQSLFERRNWAEHGSQPQIIRRSSVAEVDITSRLKQRWG